MMLLYHNKYRKFGEQVDNQLRGMLAEVNWDFIKTLDMSDACKKSLSVINEYIDLVAPEKTVTIPPHKIIKEPWYTRGLLKSRNTLDKLYRKKCRSLPGSQTYQQYTVYRNMYKNLKKRAREFYYCKKNVYRM